MYCNRLPGKEGRVAPFIRALQYELFPIGSSATHRAARFSFFSVRMLKHMAQVSCAVCMRGALACRGRRPSLAGRARSRLHLGAAGLDDRSLIRDRIGSEFDM